MYIDIACDELIDVHDVRSTNAYSKLDLLEKPLLLFEFHGSPSAVQEQAEIVQEIAQVNQGMDFDWADQPEDRSRLWAARHQAYFAGLQLRPGAVSSTTDVCVPISELAQCVRSEEHTSELQSRGHLVCRLLLEKKKLHNSIHTS